MLKFVAFTRPVPAASSTRLADSSAFIANGCSQTTCLPARRAAAAWSAGRSFGEVTWTTSTASSASSSSSETYAFGTPRASARAAPRSGVLPRTPSTFTPIRRRASTCTVPMTPVPITAAPIDARLTKGVGPPPAWRESWDCLDSLDDYRHVGNVATVFHRAVPIVLWSVKCKSRLFVHRGPIIPPVVDETDPEAPSPLPDEILDDLVTVLDEIRLGRSRSRSELVQRTGLGRAIVGRRVGELIDRGLVAEGPVGPSTGGP